MRLSLPVRHLVVAGLLAPAFSQAPTQQTPAPDHPAAQQPPTTLSVDARLVNLPVVVRDKKGALIQNLAKADFSLQVDGHPQTIRYFDRDADLPLALGLLVDTSRSQRAVIDEERTASTAFLENMLTTGRDKAFVIQFARTVELLQDLTDSRPRLQAALKQLDTTSASDPQPTTGSTTGSDTDSDSDPRSDARHSRASGGTALYDAVFLASDELMAKQHGRKALILLTDGVDRGSKKNLTAAIEAAQRADTILYAVYFKGQQARPERDENDRRGGGGFPGGRGGGYPGGGYPGGGYPGGGYPGGGGGGGGGGSRGGSGRSPGRNEPSVDGRKILERMTAETGGRLFEVSRKDTVAQIYTQIGDELRAQYRLAFTPDQATAAAGYHQIDLSLARSKNLVVQTRDGYYTGTP